LLGEDPCGEHPELLLRPGLRERGVTHVVGEVQVRIVDPDRPALSKGHEAKLLTKAGHEVKSRLDVVPKLEVGRSRALEQRGRGHMHLGSIPLQVEERGVKAGEAVCHGH
jgi:hypothetical protein